MKNPLLVVALASCAVDAPLPHQGDETAPDDPSTVDAISGVGTTVRPRTRPLTLNIGQSNTVGQGDISEVDVAWAEPFPAVALSTTFAYSLAPPLSWDSYEGPLYPRRGTRFGAELSLGRALPDRDIAKCAVGSTSLADNWDPDGDWPSSNENLYTHCVAFGHEVETKHNQQVTTILWFQGEKDATQPASAAAYGDNFRYLAQRLLAEFPCARVVFYLLPRAETYADLVRAGEQDVAQDPWVTMINVDALPRLGVHFTSDGYLQLGELAAQKLASLLDRCPQ